MLKFFCLNLNFQKQEEKITAKTKSVAAMPSVEHMAGRTTHGLLYSNVVGGINLHATKSSLGA